MDFVTILQFRRAATLRSCVIRIFCIAAVALFFVQTAIAQQAPSQIMNQYRSQRITWMTNVWPFANNLFFWLALIEFAWSAAIMMLEKTDLQSWTAALIRRIMWIGAFYALLLNGRTWIPTIIDSFNISASKLRAQANEPKRCFHARSEHGRGADGSAPVHRRSSKIPDFLAVLWPLLMTVLAFIGITIQFIVAMVESYIIVAAGLIFLGFGARGGPRLTYERYIGLACRERRQNYAAVSADRRRYGHFAWMDSRRASCQHILRLPLWTLSK